MAALVRFVLIAALVVTIRALTFKQKTDKLKLDAQWINSNAQDRVDLTFVIDESGSVSSKEFQQSKKFIRSFLDYFSIAPQHGQVSVITFGSNAEIRLPFVPNDNKCTFMDKLSASVTQRGGGTNAFDGFQKARVQFIRNSRVNLIGSHPVVVFITDGYWNSGGDPRPQVDLLKKEKVTIIVLMVGNFGNKEAELRSWATQDPQNPGKQMAFTLTNFTRFAEMANYLHKGSHKSVYNTIKTTDCKLPCGTESQCYCDSFGRGTIQCGCEKGYFNKVLPSHSCAACPRGTYQDEINVELTCKRCPSTQTTGQVKSVDIRACICDKGFWSPTDRTSKPPRVGEKCVGVTCDAKSQYDLITVHHVAVLGTCKYKYDTSCNFGCLEGFVPKSVNQMTSRCGEHGLMHPTTPVCDKLVCPALTGVANSGGWKCSDSTNFQSICRNKCDRGYYLRPGTTQFMRCAVDRSTGKGKWSGDSLICDQVRCAPLPDVRYGSYSNPHCADTKSDKVFGMKCAAACNPGYKIDTPVAYTCQDDGTWENELTVPTCKDNAAPTIRKCPAHKSMKNDEAKSYAAGQIEMPIAVDNSGDKLKIKVFVKKPGDADYKEIGALDFDFPIGNTNVKFEVSDSANNVDAKCTYQVTVEDIETPIVETCAGPKTDADGFIYTDQKELFVTWEEPVFSDNSGSKLEVFRTSGPGKFKPGQRYAIKYTATDKAKNQATCEFSFKLTGIRCPELVVPHNGALVCDQVVFGIYCMPQCQRGYKFLVPDKIPFGRMPFEYLCASKGEWRPHGITAPCAVKVAADDDDRAYEFRWFDGDCQDEKVQAQIIKNTIDALSAGITAKGQVFGEEHGKNGFKQDDFYVKCGPKNESIVVAGGLRNKRSIEEFDLTQLGN